jgi:Zn finger protein HypA/HybF involved in hydrogenase expression
MSLEKNIQEFLGPQGLMVLQKALKQVQTDPANMVDFMESLQILPRAVLSWAFNIAKNLPLNGQKMAIPSTEYVLSLKKNDGKFDFEIIKKTEVVVSQQSVELPSIVLKILELTASLDFVEKGFNDNVEDLQKAINFLVEKFHFDKNKITVTINKNETFGTCEDCGQNIKIDENHKKLCICYKVLGKTLHVKKNESGSLTVNFSGKWDKQNVYLLMKTLKAKL